MNYEAAESRGIRIMLPSGEWGRGRKSSKEELGKVRRDCERSKGKTKERQRNKEGEGVGTAKF